MADALPESMRNTKAAPDQRYSVGNARTVYLPNGWERYQDSRAASLCALILEADPFQTAGKQ